MRNDDRPDVGARSGARGALDLLDRYPFTLGVLLANALLFAFAAARSGGPSVAPDVLVALGSNVGSLVPGEPWRLLTSAFLHHDLLHLAFNGFALYSIGRVLEVHFGSARLWVLFVAMALAGGVASFAWQAARGAPAISAGASGGVLGLITLGWSFARANPARLGTLEGSLRSWLVWIAVFSVLFFAQLDHAGHLGGAAAGLAAGQLVRPRPGADTPPAWEVLAHACSLAVLGAFAAVVVRLRDGPPPL